MPNGQTLFCKCPCDASNNGHIDAFLLNKFMCECTKQRHQKNDISQRVTVFFMILKFVGHYLATKVFTGKIPAAGWV